METRRTLHARRALATTGIAAMAMAGLATPTLAQSERMALECTGGTLAGHTIERSNGASWWDQDGSAVYTTRHLQVSSGDEVVFEKIYGVKSGPSETCTGEHFGFTWDVELAVSGRR